MECIRVLENNLCCQAVTIDAEDLAELNRFVPRPKEEVVYYGLGGFYRVPKLYQAFLEAGGEGHPIVKKFMVDSLDQCDEFGTWWGSRALEYAYINLVRVHARGKRRSRVASVEDGEVSGKVTIAQDEEMRLDHFIDFMEKKIDAGECGDLRILKREEGSRKRTRSEIGTDVVRDLLPKVVIKDLSPKLQLLFELLEGYRGEKDFCGIVFVEKRKAAQILHAAILHAPGLEFIRPAVLVGHGEGSKTFGIQMMSRDQERVVKMFREGRFNLLVATKVLLIGI
jgi:endoribonuclease Dicer